MFSFVIVVRFRRAFVSAAETIHFPPHLSSAGATVGMDMVRTACATRAHTAVFQLQDVLGLGRGARMNTPGTPSGNWAWRVSRRDLSAARARQLHELLDATDRLADR